MLCPKCNEGKFRSTNGGYRKRTGKYTRTRTCDKCGFKTKTIEITIETYVKENRLMSDIVEAVNRYSDKQVE